MKNAVVYIAVAAILIVTPVTALSRAVSEGRFDESSEVYSIVMTVKREKNRLENQFETIKNNFENALTF